jgi:hypothetical protein
MSKLPLSLLDELGIGLKQFGYKLFKSKKRFLKSSGDVQSSSWCTSPPLLHTRTESAVMVASTRRNACS